MAVITLDGHTSRALDWYNKCKDNQVWFCIGGQEKWNDDDVPDPETEDEILNDPIAFKRLEQFLFVIPDETGPIYYHGDNYRTVSESEIYTEHCRMVLCNCFLNYDELPVVKDDGTPISFRKIGICTNVVPVPGKEDSWVLLPEDIQDIGHVDIIANDTASYRSPTKREKLQLIAEF